MAAVAYCSRSKMEWTSCKPYSTSTFEKNNKPEICRKLGSVTLAPRVKHYDGLFVNQEGAGDIPMSQKSTFKVKVKLWTRTERFNSLPGHHTYKPKYSLPNPHTYSTSPRSSTTRRTESTDLFNDQKVIQAH